jgi:DNA-binding LacI/PurR family transcriptional regulator
MHVGRHGYKNGYDSMGELLKKDIEGVVTTDDILAFGAVRCMNDNNVSFPITGFNNTMITEIIKPHLTSVDIRAEKLGYEACSMLISHLENGKSETNKSQQIDAKIVHRESTDF